MTLPDPGDPAGAPEPYRLHAKSSNDARGNKRALQPGTIYGCVMDREGNGYSATLSDPQYDTPIIPGLGFAPSGRGCQSRLTPGHPSVVAPGKRPLSSMTPTFVEDDRGTLVLGTPGGSRIISMVALGILDYVDGSTVDIDTNKTIRIAGQIEAIGTGSKATLTTPANIRILEGPYKFGDTRAVLIEDIDGLAFELIEGKR